MSAQPQKNYEERDTANLKLNELSLSVFTPYTLHELEAFNTAYDAAREEPIVVSLNGHVVHGRKRFEAARLRAAQNHRKVFLNCLVLEVMENYDIWKLCCTHMAADAGAHTHPADIALAHRLLRESFPTGTTRLAELIELGGLKKYDTERRRKIYSSPLVSYEVREKLDKGLIIPATLVHLVRIAEQSFGAGRQATVLPHKQAAARSYLDKIVEATIREEPLPKAKSPFAVVTDAAETAAARNYFETRKHGTAPSLRTARERNKDLPAREKPQLIPEANFSETPRKELWKEFKEALHEHYLQPLLEDVDPVMQPTYRLRYQEIVERAAHQVQSALDSAKKQLQTLKRQAASSNTVRFIHPVTGRFQKHYEKLGIDPLDEDTLPDAALEQLKQAYRSLMHRHHPDKGGEHTAAASINKAYEELTTHWANKKRMI